MKMLSKTYLYYVKSFEIWFTFVILKFYFVSKRCVREGSVLFRLDRLTKLLDMALLKIEKIVLCCAGYFLLFRPFSRCGKQGLLSPCVAWAAHGWPWLPLVEHRPRGAQAPVFIVAHVGLVVVAPGL